MEGSADHGPGYVVCTYCFIYSSGSVKLFVLVFPLLRLKKRKDYSGLFI